MKINFFKSIPHQERIKKIFILTNKCDRQGAKQSKFKNNQFRLLKLKKIKDKKKIYPKKRMKKFNNNKIHHH